MAILKIVKYGDACLRGKAKEISKFSKKIKNLVEDMIDTMYAANGVGLAAPQVGENLRIFVIDTSDPDSPPDPRVFLNPKIIKKSGAMSSQEGCLSFPEVYTDVRRYENITIKAQDLYGKPFITEAKWEQGELFCKAIQHEMDHLDGVLFIDHARNIIETNILLQKYSLPPVETSRLLKEDELEGAILAKMASGKEG